VSAGPRDRFHQTKAEAFARDKRREPAQRELQMAIVHRAIPGHASTQLLDRLAADDVDAWQSILFPGGQ
jgi:hypothetical protein